ncbi:MAG: HAD-IIA family hydrolase [Alicyclobacillus sp.]|nr:HAD-IIA family hydrolase [Alicyclobacillus sp.]
MSGHEDRRWSAALIDLDGTLYRGQSPIRGADAFVERLRQRGIQPIFFTNNATRSPVSVVQRLERFGIDAHPHEVCTAAQSAAALLKAEVGNAVVLMVGEDGLRTALEEAGLRPVSIRHPKLGERLPHVQAAVMGLDQQVTYAELDRFCCVVTRLGSFYLTNGDVRLPRATGFQPGCGALGAFVATATGLTPVVAGKPNPAFVQYALERFDALPEETLLIGDNPATDIACGAAAGLYTIQVLSGVSATSDRKADTVGQPEAGADEVVDSVADLFVSETIG